jgi:hypothetical protein
MAVIRNCKPELAVVPFILITEVLYGGSEECSFYSSDFTFCNLISNSMAVIRNCKPELAVVPFILIANVLYGGS